MLLLGVSAGAGETDWRIEAFDKAQALFAAFEVNEGKQMEKIEPRVGEFYEAWIALQDSFRKVGRYAFLKRLREDPQSINWQDPWVWSSGLRSTAEAEFLAEADQNFRSIYGDYLAKKEAVHKVKELNWLRNKAYERHRSKFVGSEQDLENNLLILQAEVKEKIANQAVKRTGSQ